MGEKIKMHDYDISWDYVLDDNVDRKHITLLKKIVKSIKKISCQ